MDKVFGPISGALLIAALAGIIQAIKQNFNLPVLALWGINLFFSLIFIGGGTLYFAEAFSWRVVFEAIVYSVIAALSVIGFWNVASNFAGGRVTNRAG